ncbi:MAG: hypothetical protein EBX47_10865 [Synechococcaceae bacterium WB8_1B_057]|nr:hypothetical protein [Synechococcaceae bacterium WB6_1A_059]NDG79913.1 hypothetical protein [Synechococcaceae bacterium WB8_1B_057]
MKPRAGILVHHPECSIQSATGIYEALGKDFKTQFFHNNEISDKFLKKFDLIVFPGGIGDADSYDRILKPYEDSVKNYVVKGGSYLGVCMGAYWAGHHYFDILDGVKAVQYIKRPRSDVKRSFGTTARITWEGQKHDMFFYDGCSLIGKESKFQIIARYFNNDPMAIIQDRIGVIGCHPESMPSWYNKKFIQDRWHKYEHHRLLLNFTKILINQ